MTTLEGIDVSDYQGLIDWRQVRLSGKHFAIAKATEGDYNEQHSFVDNWPQMADFGLVRGAYHYLIPGSDPAGQADYFHRYVRACGRFRGGDFAVIDIEEMNGQSAEYVIAVAEAFVLRVRETCNVPCVVYTYPDFWLRLMGNPVSATLGECPLWLADDGPSVPPLAGWPSGLAFWQYSSTGHCPGVPAPVDLNRFYGDARQLSLITKRPYP